MQPWFRHPGRQENGEVPLRHCGRRTFASSSEILDFPVLEMKAGSDWRARSLSGEAPIDNFPTPTACQEAERQRRIHRHRMANTLKQEAIVNGVAVGPAVCEI